MKKIILILLVLIVSSCNPGVSKRIPLKKGDVRITITDTHVIHETCREFNGLGMPIWTLEYIESKNEYEKNFHNE